jgi:TolB-like protein
MRNALVAALALSLALPAAAETRIKLAVLDLSFQAPDEADKKELEALSPTISGLISTQLSKTGVFEVITQSDVRQMIDFDEMKTTLSCDEEASCLAEIGAALGVPYMLAGNLAKFGGNYVLTLTLLDIEAAKPKGRETKQFTGVGELMKDLEPTVESVVRDLLFQRKGTLVVTSSQEGSTVEMDGVALGTTPFTGEVASGPHRVTVTKEGFIQEASDVRVTPDEEVRFEAKLRPSAEFIADYKARTGGVRVAAWSTLVGAVALGAGAGGVYGYGLARVGEFGTIVDGAVQGTTEQKAERDALQATVIGLGIASGVSAVVSGGLFVVGEDPDKWDALAE